ncbi:MAG: hypothetical protein AABZ33_01415 [Chloroflexota bacterium]
MTTTIAGFAHTHVTEREIAHMSPCGWDDRKWEDCTFMSAIEWWRATGHPRVPASHEEGERLRCDSGRSVLGGSNLGDVSKAIARRYTAATPATVSGFAALWTALLPGTVAVAQGSMGAFLPNDRWRRWDKGFGGAHAVCIFRPDVTERVWWCDPLAPIDHLIEGEYNGEWMSRAELKQFVDGLSGHHLVGRVVPTQAPEEEDVNLTAVKGEDWTPREVRRPFRATPDRKGAIVGYVEFGEVVRTIAEATTSDGHVWRLTEIGDRPAWLLRSDFDPLVQGGDPAVDAALSAYLART